MLGEFLYQLSPRDLQSQGIIPVRRAASASAVAATLSATVYDVPFDVLLVIAAVGYRTSGTGIGTSSMLRCYPPDSPTQVFECCHAQLTSTAVGSPHDVGFTSQHLFIPPGYRIDFVCRFNSGATNNDAQCILYGYQIPRGNIALP